MTPVYISFAGSFGAVCRFVFDGHVRAKYDHGFPWATLIINVSGSFILGLVDGALVHHYGLKSVGAIIGVGFCGGYTTFSTASFETVRLLERQHYLAAFGNAIGGLGATVAAAAIGLFIGLLL
jgi:CrcB protein